VNESAPKAVVATRTIVEGSASCLPRVPDETPMAMNDPA
jgi:hypothetical protein